MTSGLIGQRPTFTALPNWLRGKATPLELATLWVLQSHWPNIHPSLSLLAQETCLSRRTVMSVLTGLERKGWIRRQRRISDQGCHEATLYGLTIWDPEWSLDDIRGRAPDAPGVGHDVHGGRAPDAPGVGHQMPRGRARRAPKEEQLKKNKNKKEEPPFNSPQQGGADLAASGRREIVKPCQNGDTEGSLDSGCANPDSNQKPEASERGLGAPTSVQKQPQQPFTPWGTPNPSQGPTEPSQGKPPKKAGRSFQPTTADIPAELLPVAVEILGFWEARTGKRTERAWLAQIVQLRKIWQDPCGGTDVLRSQLETGINAGTFGRGWQAITHSNWERFGKIRPQVAQVGLTKNMQTSLEALRIIRSQNLRVTGAN